MDMAPETQKFVRVEPADPSRCKGTGQQGEQCPFQGLRNPAKVGEFLPWCTLHMGGVHAATAKREAKKLYHLEKYRGRIDRLGGASDVGTNLDEELGILRMLLEESLAKFTDLELITGAGQISALVRDIRDTLTANKKIKSAMGELLDRAAMDRLCDKLVGVICKHVEADKMDEVSTDVAGAVAEAIANRMGE